MMLLTGYQSPFLVKHRFSDGKPIPCIQCLPFAARETPFVVFDQKTSIFLENPENRSKPPKTRFLTPPLEKSTPRICRKPRKTPFFDKMTPNRTGKTHFFRALGVPQEWHFLPFLPLFYPPPGPNGLFGVKNPVF